MWFRRDEMRRVLVQSLRKLNTFTSKNFATKVTKPAVDQATNEYDEVAKVLNEFHNYLPDTPCLKSYRSNLRYTTTET